MRLRFRSGLRAFLLPAAGLMLATLSGSNAYSQACPVAANCNPSQSADFDNNTVFESGIRTVTIGSMTNNTSANSPSGTSNGYTDYSCQGGSGFKGVTISANQNVPITIVTGVNVPENVRVYLDMNNDGVFNTSNELVFSSNNATTHTGNLNIPATATQNTSLRLRIVTEYVQSLTLPSPCKALEYGQAEDYYVIVTQNTNPPIADFNTTETVTCDGSVCFTDLSQNSPAAWAWNFGDGGTSTQQNPCHTYTTAGVYTVTLTVTNSNGTDSETKINYITYNSNVPVAASCTPTTQNFCCDYGIGNVTFGGINKSSGTAVEGYQDNTCTSFTNVTEGISYPISISTTGSLAHDVTAWLDLNNNGIFTANEQIFSAVNVTDPTGNITIPTGALTNTPLRLRIMVEATGLAFSACTNLNRGQAEDYTVIIKPNLGIPSVAFSTQNFSSCNALVTFVNQTTNTSTTNTQYTWTFGDGFTQTVTGNSSVTHTYPATAGTYSVKLKACNTNGCDSLTKFNYISLTPGIAFCDTISMPTTGVVEINSCTGVIYDNGGPTANYSNSTNGYLRIAPPGAGSVTVTINSFQFENAFDVLYIYDGANSSSPLLAALTGNTVSVPQSFVSTGSVITLRQVTDQVQNFAGFSATWQCTQASSPPIANFNADFSQLCTGIVSFTDNSAGGATSYSWNFGDGSPLVTTKNPTHTYQSASPASYDVTLIACNAFGCDTMVKTAFVNITVPCVSYCASSGHNNANQYTKEVSVGGATGINNTTGAEPNGYGDYTSQNATVSLNSSVPYTVLLGTNFQRTLSIWIDWNKNGNFETTEQVVNSQQSAQQPGGGIGFSGNIAVPGTAQLGSTRMRIFTRLTGPGGNTDPCLMNSQGGEVEDYTLIIQGNNQPVVANFLANPATTCDGTVSFTDQSLNGASSWVWNFGDNSPTVTTQNPVHSYSTVGTYQVTLIGCNAIGCDTITKSVVYNPAATACDSIVMPVSGTLPVITRCTGRLYDNGGPNANYTSNANSYVTIAPTGATSVTLTFQSFATENNFDFVRVYDGPSTGSPQLANLSGSTLPASITSTGGALTVQFVSDQVQTAAGFAATWQCNQPNQPPIAQYTANLNTVCTGVVSFTDGSANSPTSWSWNFGDGSPLVTTQNPTHTYQTTTPASYTVTLVACNAFGCDTVVKSNLVNITVPCNSYCTSSGHNNAQQYISQVTIGAPAGISNTSGSDPNGYGNYSSQTVTASQGNPVPYVITLGTNFQRTLSIWIDWNQNGTFETTEQVVSNQQPAQQAGGLTFSGSFTVPATALAGTTRIRIFARQSPQGNNDPCYMSSQAGEVEDYSINVITNTQPPIAAFTASATKTCIGNPICFTDKSLNVPTSWSWDFGDGTNSTVQNPCHVYAATGTYTVILTATNSFGNNAVTQANYIQIVNGVTVLPASCTPVSTAGNANYGIQNVSFNLINNSSGNATEGYKDFSCSVADTLVVSMSYQLSISTYNTNQERTRAWIDWNNDGVFAGTEQVMGVGSFNSPHQVNVAVPANAVQNVYLRMRISSDWAQAPAPTACSNTQAGQTEDYSVYVVNGLGTADNQLAAQVQLYPNPSHGQFSLSLPTGTSAKVEITNLLGATVHNQLVRSDNGTIIMPNPAAGVYAVKVTLGNTVITKKLVIE